MEYKATHRSTTRSGPLTVDATSASLLSPARTSTSEGPMDIDEELKMKGM
jgi:hypothetical protein